jgi:hypothetical protein
VSGWLDSARYPPFAHQVIGVQRLSDAPFLGLFDEMGAGKTKQVIDAAQVLYGRGEIGHVIVVAPASVRAVWADPDPEIGELAKHLWCETPAVVTEYHARVRRWLSGPEARHPLEWLVTNYDFVRDGERRDYLASLGGPRTLLVLDESSAVKNHRAIQTRACYAVRKTCGRVWLLNGTPVAHNPLDMYAQGQLLSPKILDVKSFFHFRARYAIMGGWRQKQIIGWQNLEDLQRRFAPHVLRRLKTDCLDLPPKLPAVTLTVSLAPETWAVYREMRDEMVAWLGQQTVSVAAQAGVKAMRLAQITSGFLGGIQEERPCSCDGEGECSRCGSTGVVTIGKPPVEIGREKLDLFLGWLNERLTDEPGFKVLVWCRFRAEVERLLGALPDVVERGAIWGGQSREERGLTLRLLSPGSAPAGPVVVVGTPASGSMGLNLAAASAVVYVSNDHSLKTRLQSEDRVHRPGQTRAVSYFDVMATGPRGQRTIDHAVIKALREKQDLATWTCSAWVSALKDD